ncbi:MAG: DUF2914 domain-containing protein [Desulfamplus sp.]|nr:DUF2914 domain-containing protein [Desulfamplus sp.]
MIQVKNKIIIINKVLLSAIISTVLLSAIIVLNPKIIQCEEHLIGDASSSKVQTTSTVLVLTKAVMCEYIKDFGPAEPAIVFSVSLGKIFCFTAFENISQNAFVYHKWYHRDRFVATNRFLVKSPQWSTFSTMQLRMADKGPWRVEITDENDNLLETLRFSVVD